MNIVYVDVVGNDSNDGTTSATAVKTIQKAFDLASQIALPLPASWTEVGNVGYPTPCVTVQMAPATAANPYTLTQPVFLEHRTIILRGDPVDGLSYNIYANNSLQGLTAQSSGHLICDGFTIRGDPNCTSLNTLRGGYMSIKNIWLGGVDPVNHPAAVGAAGGSQMDIIGPIHLIGAGFVAVFTTLEAGRIMLCPGHEIDLHNAMSFGIMCNVTGGEMWTQNCTPNFTGHTTDSTGTQYACYWGGRLMFDNTLIPGSPGSQDGYWVNDTGGVARFISPSTVR